MSNRFQGKACLVTGASSGIGRAIALQLADEGALVGIVARSVEKLEAVAGEIADAGGEALALPADVTVAADVDRVVAELTNRAGRLDGVAHAAGLSQTIAPIVDLSDEDWDAVFDTNAKSCFLVARAVMPHLKAGQGGSVVNVSSAITSASVAQVSIYSAAKAAVDGFTSVAALEGAEDGIRFNAVAPGLVRTPMLEADYETDSEGRNGSEAAAERMIPIRRVIEPLEVAKLVCFLLSDDAAAITGAVYRVDGGWLSQVNVGAPFGA